MPIAARHARPRPHRRRRIVVVALLSVCALVVGVLGGGLLWAKWQLSQVPTFTAGPAQPAGRGAAAAAPRVEEPLRLPPALEGVTTFLVFTTGGKDMTAEDAKRYGVTDLKKRGEDSLTDSIILAVLDAPNRQLSLLSIPRDTWMDDRGARINETYLSHGAAALADDVTSITGLPVNHMVAVSFTAAARLTDVVGGVDLQIPVPMRDRKSLLLLPDSGCIHMDGRTALAFARSRHTQTKVDGTWHQDPSASDFGRSTRQQAVITAALGKLLTPKLPLYLPDLAATARDTLTIDAGLDLGAIFDTGRVLATGDALTVHHYGLPSRIGKVGEASVVFTEPAGARTVLAPLIAAVPGASWPAWLAPRSGAASSAPTPTSQASDAPSSTTVVGSGTSVAVEGFQTGPNTGYRACSDGVTPPKQPTTDQDPRFFRTSS